MHRSVKQAVLCLTILICAGTLAFGATYTDDQVVRFNVPHISKAPVIDGRISPDEWRQATKVMGVIGLQYGGKFIDRPVSFWVAWDQQHLYIASRIDVLPGHRLYRTRRERYDTGNVFDDAFEYGIFMHDRNKKVGEASGFMKMVINSLGSGEYMKIYPSIGQNMYNWQPDNAVADQIYKADGQEWWDQEISMDLASLDMPVPNKVGDLVDILLAADMKNPGWQWLDFPSASAHLEHYGYPRTILTNDQPYIQIERFSGLADNKLDLKTTLYNPGDKPVSLEASVDIDYTATPGKDAKARSVVAEKQTITVPAHGSARFDLDKSFPDLTYTKNNWGGFENASEYKFVVRPSGDPKAAPVYQFKCAFAGPDTVNLKADPRLTAFDYDMQFNPVNGNLLLSGDTLDAKIPEGSKPDAMTYTVTKGGQPVKSGKITQCIHFKYDDMIRLPGLAAGKYNVKLALVDASGKELVARDDISFEKKDESKDFAKWWNNKLGDTDKVLKPFEALKVKGSSVSCTRREYQLDGLGLPAQIVSNGGNLLARPARLVVTVGGKEYPVPIKGGVAFTSKKDWRVEFTGAKTSIAGVTFSSKGWMEQDGLVNIELTYAPQSSPVAIDALRVEFPIDGTDGSWMSCIGGIGGNYAPRFIGKVPDGQGLVWDTLSKIGKMGSTMLVGNWENNLWVGNEYRGFCWFADNDKGWVQNDKSPAHSIVRTGKAVEVRNNIIDQPKGENAFVLSAPRTVQLQYNATPFRHLAKGWRLNQVSAANGFASPKYKTNEKTKQEYFSILSMPSTDLSEWDDYYKEYKEAAANASKRGYYNPSPRLTTYLTNQIALRGYMDKTTEPGLYDYFRADWVPGNESLNKSYTDYMAYLMNRHMREGGVTHYYFDISFSRDSVSLPAGLGYRLPDGRVQPTSMDGTLRDWYKRVWALAQENNLYPGAVSGHATNSICLKALPWTDAILDSEYPMKDPITVYPPDRMIALSHPETFGVHICHLGFMNPNWAAMHDCQMGGAGGLFSTAAFRHFGITREDVEFVPYWRNKRVVKKTAQGELVSIWRRPGAAIIAVLNYGLDPEGQEKSRAGDMTLDLKALGIPSAACVTSVRDLWTAPQKMDSHLSSYKWYQDTPEEPVPNSWPGDKAKLRKLEQPVLDTATGRLHGFNINYHEVQYVLVTWDEKPTGMAKVKDVFTPEQFQPAIEWGINRPETKMLSAQETASCVKTDGTAKVQVWKQPGSVMLRVFNPTDKPVDANLTLDQAKLGIKVKKLWEQFVQCQGGNLDAETGELNVKAIKPGAAAVVYVDLN